MLMISPERRILILLAGMIAGIALVLAGYGSRDLLPWRRRRCGLAV
ncbi:MAG: hypothetical protein ACPHY9_08675 [Candidatus Puniceispirillaceae bacterium]